MSNTDVLSPHGRPCSICGSDNPEHTGEDDGLIWVHGYIGNLPVVFCGICYGGVVSMVRLLEGYEDDDE
jgi:hypothetical protein